MLATKFRMTALAITILASTLASLVAAAPAAAQTSAPPHRGRSNYNVCAPVDREKLGARYVYAFGLPGDTLQHDYFSKDNPASYRNNGFRPVRLTGYQAGSNTYYSTKWIKFGSGKWFSRFGIDGDTFHQAYLDYRASYRPIDVSGFTTPHGVRYNVIYEENTQGVDWRLHRDVSRPGMQDLVDQYADEGFVPVRVEGYLRDGRLNFISIWERGECRWKMHNQMTRDEYQAKLDAYKDTLRLVHLDAYNLDGEVFYAGIWWAQEGPSQLVHSNRDWYLHQRQFNNRKAEGYVIDNFLAVDDPSGWVRYGGIWTFLADPNIGPEHSLARRIDQRVNSAPGRAGAAMLNLTTGEEIMINADQQYGTSSTIKSAILYALLRKADAEGFSLGTTFIGVGKQYGSNNDNLLTEDGLYSLAYLAQIMLSNSHNWATNRLIDFVGMDTVNEELDNLGLSRVRLNRYMTGSGAPSTAGNSSPGGDYRSGIDNLASPREYATFLKLVYENQDGLLSQASYDAFWATMNPVDSGWLMLYSKGGSNTWTGPFGDFAHRPQISDHLQRSLATVMEFSGGDVVVLAMFIDENDVVDDELSWMPVTCATWEVWIEYSSLTSADLPAGC